MCDVKIPAGHTPSEHMKNVRRESEIIADIPLITHPAAHTAKVT
jgi:hypothetical protein